MEKLGVKTRDILFQSGKNDKILCVHSRYAKQMANRLEASQSVASYVPCYPWDDSILQRVNKVEIRRQYFQTPWTSDFFVTYTDGRVGIYELCDKKSIYKRATQEKLELSRRYWKLCNVAEWKIILV